MYEFAAQKGVPLGVGTGWRENQPDKPGFAPNGNSNHQGFMEQFAVAIDNVPEPSFGWMQANCSKFGLRTFRDVNNEPWHTQPIEIPASRSYRTDPWNLVKFPLPGFSEGEEIEEEEEMPLTDDDCKRIAKAVWDEIIAGDSPDEKKPARWRLKSIQNMCRYYLGGVKESTELPDQTLLKQIHQNTKP